MSSENACITVEQARKDLEYAVNLCNCIETPLDDRIIAFAEQDKTATAYRNLALRKLKGEDVEGYLFTARNSALDRFYHWQRWIREYEEGSEILKFLESCPTATEIREYDSTWSLKLCLEYLT
jgi:hypothetical protein